MFLKLFTLTLLLFFSSCSTRGVNSHKRTIAPAYKSNTITTALLYKEYEKYSHTRYKYGGQSTNGIDCSALVQAVYKNSFHKNIPRTTRDQAKIGYKVDKKDAKPGDIILFKTGYNVRHSGIIIEKGKFLHSSTKHGVVITDIEKPYYKKRYWQIRRVL
jgi:cell wall-associated NlpC family hydrolase